VCLNFTKKRLIRLVLVAGLVVALVALAVNQRFADLFDQAALRAFIDSAGPLGPLAIIGLMTLAIVMSPLPSAPVALVAGAAYGHTWGTVYVVIGAELGALIAFAIARVLGYEMMKNWFGDRLSLGLLKSQNLLMVTVFVARLVPFISFDLVSYAAGLTPLAAWRFAAATLLGILPASFILAHLGGEMTSADPLRIGLSVLALGAITAIPLVTKVVVDWRKRRSIS
jgi:uncharacterized membrane protein YdjX (TVP38/TMEM64 family)